MTNRLLDAGHLGVSVVISTYNRRNLVAEAVASALGLLEHAQGEVIVVDDASSDGTLSVLENAFRGEIIAGRVRVIVNPANLGVTGAKNAGARRARGDWIIFLDSDDLLRPESLVSLVKELDAARGAPLVFFRCTDSQGRLIGNSTDGSRLVSVADLLTRWAWGECLPVVRREAFGHFPYDGDLKGHEGLAYGRMLTALGPAVLSALPVRVYRTSGLDRLSMPAGVRARSCELARGHWRVLREFPRVLGFRAGILRFAKIVWYTLHCLHLKAHEALGAKSRLVS